MRIFDANIITVTTNPDPLTDNTLPPARWLDYGSITSDSALRTTTGLECAVVHGRRELHVIGAMNEVIENDLTTTINGNETRTVAMNFTETITGQVTLTVMGGWQESQYGALNRYYDAVVTDTFHDDHQTTQPTSADFQVSATSNTFIYGESISIVMFFQLQACIFLGITVATGIDLEGKMIHAEYHWGHGDGKFMKMYEVEASVDINGVRLHAGTEAAVRASANAGVDADAACPVS